MKKRILIFGANGGIGRYLVDYFDEHNHDGQYEIIGVGTKEESYSKNVADYVQVDISKKEQFERLPKDVYAVIHLAGRMPACMEGYRPEEYITTNILGTFNILQYCVENNVDRILFSQSFGDIKEWGEKGEILTPWMVPNYKYAKDHSVYVASKNAAVEIIKCYHALHGIKSFIFRLPNIYFWSKNDTFHVDGVLRKIAWRTLIDKATTGETIEIWGDASRLKDMIYVKDLCQMLFKACFVERDYGYYNVGTGVGTSLEDQIKGMIEVFGEEKKSDIVYRPDMPNAPQYIMYIENARSELGYEPQYSYIDMLKDIKKERELYRY